MRGDRQTVEMHPAGQAKRAAGPLDRGIRIAGQSPKVCIAQFEGLGIRKRESACAVCQWPSNWLVRFKRHESRDRLHFVYDWMLVGNCFPPAYVLIRIFDGPNPKELANAR